MSGNEQPRQPSLNVNAQAWESVFGGRYGGVAPERKRGRLVGLERDAFQIDMGTNKAMRRPERSSTRDVEAGRWCKPKLVTLLQPTTTLHLAQLPALLGYVWPIRWIRRFATLG